MFVGVTVWTIHSKQAENMKNMNGTSSGEEPVRQKADERDYGAILRHMARNMADDTNHHVLLVQQRVDIGSILALQRTLRRVFRQVEPPKLLVWVLERQRRRTKHSRPKKRSIKLLDPIHFVRGTPSQSVGLGINHDGDGPEGAYAIIVDRNVRRTDPRWQRSLWIHLDDNVYDEGTYLYVRAGSRLGPPPDDGVCLFVDDGNALSPSATVRVYVTD